MVRTRRRAVPSASPPQFVLDCSLALAWYFADESGDYANAVSESLRWSRAIVPSLWPLEIANALVMGERRQRSTEAQATAFLTSLQMLHISLDDATAVHAWTETLGQSRALGLSAYDAAYIELALRRGLPLATLDNRLERAAQSVGIARFDPAIKR